MLRTNENALFANLMTYTKHTCAGTHIGPTHNISYVRNNFVFGFRGRGCGKRSTDYA